MRRPAEALSPRYTVRWGDDIIIQITSESLGIYQSDEQIAVVKATKPEAASLARRELAPDPSWEGEFSALLGLDETGVRLPSYHSV